MGSGAGKVGRAERLPMLFLFLLLLFCPALCEQIRYRIPEEMPKGSVVGNLATDLGLSVQELPTRKLRVSSEKPYFTVSAERGELLVSSRLDREEICGKNPACALEFEAVAENPLNFYHVNVEIEDINDHTPTFTQNSFELQISESAQPGTRFILGSAHDADIGSNTLQNYQLNPSDHFSLINKEKSDGSKYPEMVLKTPLDREKQKSYHLTLTALDFGAPPLSSTAQIHVLVTDANDNAPVFSQDVYRVSLSENVYPGTTVLQVTATDQDEGINAEITFSFSEASQITQFDLNSNTGEITVLNTLDFEEVNEYSIVLEARDGGGMIAQCTVEVEVIDENDNAPEVIFQSLPNLIMEDAELGTHIALLKVRDKDSRHNGEVTCKLEDDVPFKILTSSRNTYKLVTDAFLDREQNPEYNITITATDRGKPPLSSSSSITLHIGDVNDNAPVFSQSSYIVYVAENNPPGASISQVSASDPDLGPNGQVSYSIVASDLEQRELSSYVSISTESGVVFAQRAFDHEQLRSFKLTLQARDQGSPALSANVSLRVLVGDRNDNAPRVLYPALGPDGSALFDMVPRAAEPGYLVTKVVAVDADSGHNAWLSYHVLQASEPGLFSLGLRTGEVRTERALGDRDAARQRLLVAVRDGGQPPLSATVTLHLVFADSLQEVLPDITDRPVPSDPQAELQFYLVVALALISVLFLLAMILAIALRLRRSSSPAAWSCFQPGHCVKSESVVPPNYSEGTLPYSYNLCVAHTGKTEFNFLKCSEQLSSGQDILCGDSSAALFPLCNSSELTSHQVEDLEVKINEIAVPGARYPLPEAVDPDVGVNSLQSYQLNPNHHFSLDVQTGDNGVINPELVLQRALDREEEAAHHLVLTASDGGEPRRSSTVRIRVTVLDTNDNAPVFAQPIYRVKVLENVPPGTRLLTVTASDPDEGINGKVAYKFRKINEKQTPLFQLNENTGEISIAKSLDYEECSFYEMEIQAEDVGALLGRTKLFISVEDVNDNRPEVIITSLFSPVLENSLPGTVIAFLSVHDQDSGKNGQVVCYTRDNLPFKLEESIDNYYRLVTRKYLDRENVSIYNITVMASDLGTPPLSTETHIALHVADINDNPPTFPRASYSAYILENNLRGASIFSLTAHDPDSQENAQVTYSVTEDTLQGAPLSSYISINSDTGVLYALQSFDYEQIRDLQLLVTASDSGDPPLSSNVSLNLFVLDQNDNAPEILYPALPTDGSTGVELAPRSAEPGYLVTKVVAVDRDSGQNAWLSYRLLKASEPGLFAVGLHTGEVRTARPLLDRDALKQSLVVVVQDHGQPPLSATVTLTVAVADSIPAVLTELGSLKPSVDPNDSSLTLYLVVAVAAVSCVFLAFVVVLLGLRLRRWHKSRLLQGSGGRLVGVPASHFVGVEEVQAFLQTYSHEVSLTADSRKSHLIFPQPNYADTLISQESCEKNDSLLTSIDFHECKNEADRGQVSLVLCLLLISR
uniref:Cadherin domain-containing protein n=5 Tax=Macaca mulatta TaxID=9544 RepID=F6S8K5_MACMU